MYHFFQNNINKNFDSENCRIHIINKIFLNKFFLMILRLGTATKKTFRNVPLSLIKRNAFSFQYSIQVIYRFYRFSIKPMSNYNICLWYYRDGVLTSRFTFSYYYNYLCVTRTNEQFEKLSCF